MRRQVATAFGLGLLMLSLALTAAPPAAAQDGTAEPDLELTDAVGDVRPTAAGNEAPTPALVPTPATDAVDIIALRVWEEPTTLVVEVAVRDLAGALRALDADDYLTYQVSFALPGPNLHYSVGLVIFGVDLAVAQVGGRESFDFRAQFCVRYQSGQGTVSNCYGGLVPVTMHFLDGTLTFDVPKRFLLGEFGGTFGPSQQLQAVLPKHIDPGDRIEGWYAVTTKRNLATLFLFVGLFVWLQDRLPDGGPGTDGFELRYGAPNTRLRLSTPLEEGGAASAFVAAHPTALPGAVSVTPGRATSIPLLIENGMDAKRLVTLEAQLPPEADPRWSVRLAQAVEVPAGQSRTVNLVVEPPPGVSHRDTIQVDVWAHSLGYEQEVGYLRLHLRASVPPTPEQNTLRFHATPVTVDAFFGPPPETCNLGVFACYRYPEYWLNVLEDDPVGDLDEAQTMGTGINPFGDTVVWNRIIGMDSRSPTPLQFDVDRPADVRLTFSADRSFQANVQAQLVVYDSVSCNASNCFPSQMEVLGSGARAASITPTAATLDVPVLINPELSEVRPEHGTLGLRIVVTSPDAAVVYSQIPQLRFHVAQSSVSLPLLEPADPYDGGLPPLVNLHPTGDREEFVNPGRTKAFRVLAVNEGTEDDRIQVNGTIEGQGWRVQVEPASRYSLQPGQSVTLAVLVTAPSSAGEGERAVVNLTADSLLHDVGTSRLSLTSIATQGIDIDDEAARYEIDADTRERILADEQVESPGIDLLPLLAATVALLVAWHRRGRGPTRPGGSAS